MDEDTIEVDRKLGKIIRPLTHITNAFEYNSFFDEKIEAKKRDNSYRIFKRVQRKSGSFPRAEDNNSRTITVWCSNDYLGLGQHPKLNRQLCK
jgi:5-aminolevulinate synthase